MKLVTLNFWGIEAPLDKRLDLAARQLAQLAVDVVCMQEVRPLDGRTGRTTADVLAERLGMHARYAVATETDATQEGLAILSRAPLDDARQLVLPEARPGDTRILLSGRVGSIWVHTTHLHYRLDDGVARERQVDAIDAAIRALGRTPTDAPQILCGDFNATPDSDEMRFLRGLTTLAGRRTHFQDAWLRCHPHPRVTDPSGPAWPEREEGITWSSENELTRPLRTLDIDRRIDYVLVTSRKKDGRGTVRDCRVVLTDREDGICASDHFGVFADVQTDVT